MAAHNAIINYKLLNMSKQSKTCCSLCRTLDNVVYVSTAANIQVKFLYYPPRQPLCNVSCRRILLSAWQMLPSTLVGDAENV